MVLEEETAVFEAERARLLQSDRGRFVLIKGKEILGIFGTQDEAMIEGYTRFRRQPFFVAEISEEDPVLDVATFAFDIDSLDT